MVLYVSHLLWWISYVWPSSIWICGFLTVNFISQLDHSRSQEGWSYKRNDWRKNQKRRSRSRKVHYFLCRCMFGFYGCVVPVDYYFHIVFFFTSRQATLSNMWYLPPSPFRHGHSWNFTFTFVTRICTSRNNKSKGAYYDLTFFSAWCFCKVENYFLIKNFANKLHCKQWLTDIVNTLSCALWTNSTDNFLGLHLL